MARNHAIKNGGKTDLTGTSNKSIRRYCTEHVDAWDAGCAVPKTRHNKWFPPLEEVGAKSTGMHLARII